MSVSVTRTFVRSEVINAGRQLLMICIHLFSFFKSIGYEYKDAVRTF
ncbi:TPA: hypothetical protein SO392_005023 [Escherichia coli]|nr:hypothetical protein [Escherichia coli]HEK5775040.1 hypothetical protein [Escherichia coli]HEK5780025.1 hypothetical protein [Escherichia coli]HEK5785039.1 hypothetical protein [Escherichia coli]HEK5889196.1 hypothetical protein [Escherichia coli]